MAELPGRRFDDTKATRKSIYDNVLHAASNLPDYNDGKHIVRLKDVSYHGPEHFSIKEQKQAILENRTLGRKLKGTWQLLDAPTGQVKEEKSGTIAAVPHMTDRGTFIHNGSEYILRNQIRLKPGIYTRVKGNGEIEAHTNVMSGQGISHRHFLNPETGVFYSRVGQAKIPLMPLLRSLGASDKQLREAWGPEIMAANVPEDNPVLLNKYQERLLTAKERLGDAGARKASLHAALDRMKLDPEVTRRTLGRPHDHVSLDSILDTTKKLLAVSRGESDVDDRDHLAYQTVHGPEDLISERVAKDHAGIRRGISRKASIRGSLNHISANALNKQVHSALLGSLGAPLEETNSAEILDKLNGVTRMGEGGISGTESIPEEARSVSNSHMGFLDPIRTPESFRAGVDLYFSREARKGPDGQMYAPFHNFHTKQTEYKSPRDVADSTVAFTGEMNSKRRRVLAVKGGEIHRVHRGQVDYTVPHFENAFSHLGNMVPFKSASKGQRTAMGSRFLTQALPLTEPESPHVQTGVPDKPGESYESLYGKHVGAVMAPKAGRVQNVDEDGIHVRYEDGTSETHELYNNFPYNRKTFIHQTPTVQPGDTFQPGQALAKSNYTDEHGVTALGKNARVAFTSHDGQNFEDAFVISDSFAKKFTSEHMYQHNLDKTDEHKLGRGAHTALFPGKFNAKQIKTIDEHGVIQKGTRVESGDPLVLASRATEPGKHKVHRRGGKMFQDASLTWDHSTPGIVTDVAHTNKGISVIVKTESPMQVGDKMSGRHGNKGVVKIVPDAHMPHDKDGQPYEVLANPLGVISRTNPSQIIEAVLGKIAERTGKKYRVSDFHDTEDLTRFAQQELAKHGMSDLEDIYDPKTGRKIPNVLTGNQFFMKLGHQAEDKGQGRGAGGGYSAEGAPTKGGKEGSKRISIMDVNALLSHNALGVLKDVSQVRGQRNEDYWLAYMQGHDPPKPGVPEVYKKFMHQLQAAGIHVHSDGTGLNLSAMTNKDVDTLAGDREIRTGDTVDFNKGLTPVSGGLFDPKITGGHRGGNWGKISLHEPMLNPVMETPALKLLGMTKNKFDSVLAGREEIPHHGTGPQAIASALKSINLDKEIALANSAVHGSKKGARDEAIRKLGYLQGAKNTGVHPGEWMLNAAPVLPPIYRPISLLPNSKLPLVADSNYLYKALIDANDNLKHMHGLVDDVGDERLAVYNALKAVTGLGDPIHPKLVEKNVRGLLSQIFGASPKFGTVQRRLLSTTTDLVGRGVITPNPDMDMDRIGIPEEKAWSVYKNFVVRKLRRRGLPLAEAIRHVEDRTPTATQELHEEMQSRPVIVNRAPVLHRFGIMAFWPHPVKSATVEVSPLVVKGFGADFDGDAVQYHVPVSDDAVSDAVERMLPSRNLISPGDFKTPVHMPTNEYAGGLYSATDPGDGKKRARRFATKDDAIKAFRRGEIDLDTPVEVDT